MGGCLSTPHESEAPPPSPPRVGFHDGDVPAPKDHRRRDQMNESRMVQSLMRVGSRVVRSVTADPASGRKKYAAARASTYDHVHEMVLSNFQEADVKKRHAGIVGLQNMGNTCYLNSSLQCLSNTIPLTDYFLGYDYRAEINYDSFLGTKGELVKVYAALVKDMWLGKNRSVAPASFKARLEKFAPQFAGHAQEDAQEFLSFLLDGIHEDLNRVVKKPYIEEKDCDGSNDEGDSILSWENYLQRDRSVVVDIFQGQLRNQVTCRNANKTLADGSHGCGHKNIRFEPFMYLSLPLSDSCSSLDDCLDLFCAEEMLTGQNQWYCPKCKEHVDATKKFDIWMLPPILIVHLKRFKITAGARSKIDKPVKYPVNNWDLSRAMKSVNGDNSHPSYQLYAISNHCGGTLGSGHYTAIALNRFDDNWYEYNDSHCRQIDASDMGRSSTSYLMFYNRVETVNEANDIGSNRKPTVRRQDVDRPELWPHMQIMHENYRAFSRSVMTEETSSVAYPNNSNTTDS